jgi:hypothetical protein
VSGYSAKTFKNVYTMARSKSSFFSSCHIKEECATSNVI